MSRLRNLAFALRRDDRGGSAAEFVLVLPVLVLLVFATIDAGWYSWRINRAEKATQAGTRMAVVIDPVASGLTGVDYTVGYGLTQGDTIPATALGLLACDGSTLKCTCPIAPCPTDLTFFKSSFDKVVTRMQTYDAQVAAANVVVEYRGSGLGFAGDPAGMQIAPLVTVRLQNMKFNALSSYVWKGVSVDLPDFAYSLTMEDGSGANSN